jgi:ATP-dependent DNA helicase DinG
VEEVFGAGGRLAASLGSAYEPRDEQTALATAVAEALDGGRPLLAEAGTGVGKSLAYLIPALASGRRVVVATATKALQEQLLTKDVPIAAAALARDVRVAVLKGRQNYLCRKALQGFEVLGGALFPRFEDGEAFDAMREWISSTETGDRAELLLEPSEGLWAEIAVGSDRCAGRHCAFVGTCFSELARARAAHADLIVVNHALYFADLGVRERTDGVGVLPEHDAVVLDEAHRIEEAAATWLGGRVSGGALDRLARDVDRACREAGAPVPARALDRALSAGGKLLDAVCPHIGRRRLREAPAGLAETLHGRLVDLSASLANRSDDLDVLARRALALAEDVDACRDWDPLERVVWAESDAVVWAPIDVSAELRERLWDAGPTAVLVSATLGVAADFTFVRDRLGLRGVRELSLGSPFDFAEQALLYLPEGLPDPRSPDFLDRAADEVVELCRLSGGRALVLTSSYRALAAIAAGVRGRVPHEVLVQGESPRERLLERFRAEVDSILVATATFWQGVDVPGEALSLLVIDKLPFSVPDDPLVEARCERIAADGGDWFSEYALPSAVLQLRQGFGRLIRAQGDRGVVAVLDPRVRTRRYGEVFLQSLPRCSIARDRSAVADVFSAWQAAPAC